MRANRRRPTRTFALLPFNWRPAQTIHEHAVCGQRFVVIGCWIGSDITLDLVANHSDELLAAGPMEGAAWTPTFPDSAEMARPARTPDWHAWLVRRELPKRRYDRWPKMGQRRPMSLAPEEARKSGI
jgi:hypothetical protein